MLGYNFDGDTNVLKSNRCMKLKLLSILLIFIVLVILDNFRVSLGLALISFTSSKWHSISLNSCDGLSSGQSSTSPGEEVCCSSGAPLPYAKYASTQEVPRSTSSAAITTFSCSTDGIEAPGWALLRRMRETCNVGCHQQVGPSARKEHQQVGRGQPPSLAV